MSQQSNIEWTDATWNPVRGCVQVSPGCAHCYAETFAERFRGVPGHPYAQGFDLRLVPEKLTEPLRWKKPRRVFVNSMSDLFQDGVPDSFIDRVFAVMALTRQHSYQVLTKRAGRMLEYATVMASGGAESLRRWDDARAWLRSALVSKADRRSMGRSEYVGVMMAHQRWPLPNVWLGVSVENQPMADARVPLLLQTPAAVRFISAEPLLGPIELREVQLPGHPAKFDALSCYDDERDEPLMRGACLDWAIIGGESGPGARPCDLVWVRSIVQQCKAAGVPCFVKQLGAKPYQVWNGAERHDLLLRHAKGSDPTEWPADLRVREYPGV